MNARDHIEPTGRTEQPGLYEACAEVPLDPDPLGLLVLDVVFDEDHGCNPDAWRAVGAVEAAIETCRGALLAHGLQQLTRPAEAVIALSCNAAVRALNRTFRHQDKPTNVLSFPAAAVPAALLGEQRAPLGDIVIALETVLDEARQQGKQPLHHVQHLVVHGILHLLGFDHEDEADAEVMEALETAVLRRAGVPDPYALPPT
jgi:probable rRNA maturation factor